ncbi:MAG TPA: N-6 DNA methylase [Planctomycetota bacterium]|nr:N-6 DNA methylase [Planctomycetota bacterium]
MPESLESARALVLRHEERHRHDDARRREGRYYTPPVLVRFLVEKTLGPLVEGRSPDEILAMRILDPACGAGAFLLGALDFLASELERRGMARADASRRLVNGTLLGIDIDDDAIATARRALALASGARPRGLRKANALDDRGLARAASVPRLDAVIGNPPYRREKDGAPELARARDTELGRLYGAGKMDLWFLFAHAALLALPPGGRHGFVVPSYWLESRSARRLREHIFSETRLELLVELGARRFFKDVQGRHVLYVCEKVTRPTPTAEVMRIEVASPREGEPPLDLDDHPAVTRERVPLAHLLLPDGTVARTGELGALAARIERAGTRIDFEVAEGVTPGPEAWTDAVAERAARASGTTVEELEARLEIARGEGVFVVAPDFRLPARERHVLLPWAAPADVPAFPAAPRPSKRILYVTEEPGRAVLAHLERFRPALDRRRETRDGRRPWYELHWPRRRELFFGPRVLVPRMTARPRATYVEETLVVGESVLVFRHTDPRVTRLAAALLNTAPLRTWILARAKRRGVGVDLSVARAREIPWPRALVDSPEDVEPVARALERGEDADALAWRLYRGVIGCARRV